MRSIIIRSKVKNMIKLITGFIDSKTCKVDYLCKHNRRFVCVCLSVCVWFFCVWLYVFSRLCMCVCQKERERDCERDWETECVLRINGIWLNQLTLGWKKGNVSDISVSSNHLLPFQKSKKTKNNQIFFFFLKKKRLVFIRWNGSTQWFCGLCLVRGMVVSGSELKDFYTLATKSLRQIDKQTKKYGSEFQFRRMK